jgi:diguanylate cyclase
MGYELNRDSSGEILRLAIQKMAAHPASFTPWSYAVWFEHLTGINPALSEAIKRYLNSGEKLGDNVIEELYSEYVSECNLDIHKLLRQDIHDMLNRLAGFAMETDRQAEGYGDNLQSFGNKLKQNLDVSSLDGLIGEMLTDTESMRGSMLTLQHELKQSRQEVEKLHQELESAKGEALIDPMTGILNRRGFEKAVSHNLKQENFSGKEISLLMVDIDNFKAINDNFGHLVGDKVIKAVADMLKSKIRGQDFVARLGGEEFAVLLPDTPAQGGFSVAEHIRKGIESGRIRSIDSNKPLGVVTVSIGVASLDQGDFTDMMDKADKALYASKSSGRNRTTIHAD